MDVNIPIEGVVVEVVVEGVGGVVVVGAVKKDRFELIKLEHNLL